MVARAVRPVREHVQVPPLSLFRNLMRVQTMLTALLKLLVRTAPIIEADQSHLETMLLSDLKVGVTLPLSCEGVVNYDGGKPLFDHVHTLTLTPLVSFFKFLEVKGVVSVIVYKEIVSADLSSV